MLFVLDVFWRLPFLLRKQQHEYWQCLDAKDNTHTRAQSQKPKTIILKCVAVAGGWWGAKVGGWS